jgi:hypothetical protein
VATVVRAEVARRGIRTRSRRSRGPVARLPWLGEHRRGEERALTGNGTAGDADRAGAADDDAVLLFVGGPLDGRVEVRPARHGDPLPTITHVHLHDGPKVVHRYDLQSLPGQNGVYHLRSTNRRPVRDEPHAD